MSGGESSKIEVPYWSRKMQKRVMTRIGSSAPEVLIPETRHDGTIKWVCWWSVSGLVTREISKTSFFPPGSVAFRLQATRDVAAKYEVDYVLKTGSTGFSGIEFGIATTMMTTAIWCGDSIKKCREQKEILTSTKRH
jgi:hypothetical protein